METSQMIYYAGLGLLAVDMVGSSFLALLFFKAGKSLQKQLEAEYGKPRHS